MIKQRIAFLFLLFISVITSVYADLNSDYQGYEVYTDSNGDIILRLPPKFVLIAGDINIPLNVTPKNGVFKLVEVSNIWKLVPITQADFERLTLTSASHLNLEFYDIDGDGVVDILIRDSASYRDSFVISNLQGVANVDAYSVARNSIDLSQGTQLTVKDVNGDGIKDIVTASSTYLGSLSGELVDTSASNSFITPGNIIGLTAGQFKVTETGAATYSIPLSLPQGTAGVMPKVAISYNSQGGEGILGMGWNISGSSAITRCPKNIAIDTQIKGIQYDNSDALCFNGQRLIPNPNSSNEYSTEIDSFSVIKAYQGANGPAYFTVTNQANETHYFGKAEHIAPGENDAYVERGGFTAGSAAKMWALKAIVDHKGNYITYTYNKDIAKGSHYLTSIHYGGNVQLSMPSYNSVKFNYEEAYSISEGYAHGGIMTQDKRLANIQVKQDSDLFRFYRFEWRPTNIPEERTYVTGIQECFAKTHTNGKEVGADCLPATQFEFVAPPQKTTTYSYEMCTVTGYDAERQVNCESVSKCVVDRSDRTNQCRITANTTDYQPFSPSAKSIAESNSDRFYAQVLDFNGDGFADLLYPKNGKWHFYTSEWQLKKTTSTINLGKPKDGESNSWDDNGYVDRGDTEPTTITQTSIEGKTSVISNSSVGEKEYVRVIDYNGDGTQELLIPIKDGSWQIISSTPSSKEVERCPRYDRKKIEGGDLAVPPSEPECITRVVDYDYTYKSLNISSKEYKNSVVADVDGDGLQDIVFKSGGVLKYYRNTGGQFDTAASIALKLPSDFSGAAVSQTYGRDPKVKGAINFNPAMLDINGDGISDIILKMAKSTRGRVPPGCAEPGMQGPMGESGSKGPAEGEDCRPIITTKYKTFAFIASFEGGKATYTATSESSLEDSFYSFRGADFNGDGLTDFAYITGGVWYYRLSKGDGTFTNREPLSNSGDLNSSKAEVYNRHQFIDIDADGRTDILAATEGQHYKLLLAEASASALRIRFHNRGSVKVGSSSDPLQTTLRLADVDGDAKIDLLTASGNSGSWQVRKASRAYTKEHVLTKITNGFGVTTEIAYAPLNSGIPLLFTESSNKPNSVDYITPIAGMFVVSEAKTDAGNDDSVLVQYAYGGPLAHKKGRGFLGFEAVKTTDAQSGVVTVTQYHQLYPKTGMPRETSRYYGEQRLSYAANRYTVSTSDRGSKVVSLTGATEIAYSLSFKEDGKTVKNNQLVSTSETSNTFDEWNNLEESEVVIFNASGAEVHRTITTNKYQNSAYTVISSEALKLQHSHAQVAAQSGTQPDARRFGRLYTTLVTKIRSQNTSSGKQESQSRSSKFSYYPNGMLRESQVNGLTTAFFYDKYGNKVAEQSYAKHNNSAYQKRGQYWFYDSRGQYLAKQMNQNGESETYLYNGKSATTATPGRIYSKTTTGPNKLASTSYFDIQGQTVRQVLADGNYTETSKQLCSSCDANFITETVNSSNKPQSIRYYDKFGRQREQRLTGFDGTQIVTASSYDRLGRVTHQTVPNYGSASTVKSAQYYDALGRVYKQDKLTESGTVTVSTSLNGLVTTSYDESGLPYVETRSADGLLISRKDPQNQLIYYYYDAFGNTRKVTTKAKDQNDAWKYQSITTAFDAYGRKTTTNDPDKGQWTYIYNGFGELISQTDAKRQTSTTGYDAMGRMLWRKDNTNLACWGYGTSASQRNVGKPAWVKQWAGQSSCNTTAAVESSEHYYYDDYGRPAKTDFVINGTSYTTRSEYNAKGQLSRQHYPSNNGTFYVNFYYNANQYLYKQKDSSNRDLRKVIAMDALGNITQQSFGNGTSEVRGFNSRTGRISHIDLAKGSRDIHKLSYGGFDAKGNVQFRAHSYYNNTGGQTLSYSEDFSYDSLNRIETRSLSIGSGSLTGHGYDEKYSYDGFGNIKSRKGYSGNSYSINLASYDYLQSKSASRLNSAVVEGKTYSKFDYDANGNTISDGHRTFTYNAFDKASRIQAGSEYAQYKYNHNRAVLTRSDYRKEGSDWKTFNTDYVGKIYQQERRYKGAVSAVNLENTRHKYMVGNIMVVRNQNTTLGNSEEVQYQHTDHQGSTLTITNQSGGVLEQYFYTAFGKPMKLNGASVVQAIIPMERGYTGHEMLPGLDIIQMGGRIYDPSLARFLQADPFIQAPSNLQNYNRYSYVLNNPLTYTDPSGYFFDTLLKLGGLAFGGIEGAVLAHHTNRFIANSNTLTQLHITAVGVVSTIFCGPCSIGFTALASSTLTYYATGDLRASIYAGGRSALTAAAFYGVGQAFGDTSGFFQKNGIEHVLAHGATGGVLAELQGGSFGAGFLAAGLSKAAYAAGIVPKNMAGGIVVSAAIGGTASVISGGKFANGAVTAAFGFALNGYLNQFNSARKLRSYRDKIAKLDSSMPADRAILAAFAKEMGLVESLATDGAAIFKSKGEAIAYKSEMLGVLNSEYTKDALVFANKIANSNNTFTGKNFVESVANVGIPEIGLANQINGVIGFWGTSMEFSQFMSNDSQYDIYLESIARSGVRFYARDYY